LMKHSWTPYRVAKNEDSEQNRLGYLRLFIILLMKVCAVTLLG
jgi:hypothetical protein